jgi:hypothetical protein
MFCQSLLEWYESFSFLAYCALHLFVVASVSFVSNLLCWLSKLDLEVVQHVLQSVLISYL